MEQVNNAVRILSRQGYVPETCTIPDPPAFILIMTEINAGRSPCDGCNMDRSVCKGSPSRASIPRSKQGGS